VVFTDHASLQYLHTQKVPSKRISRWIEEFAEMDISIKYKKGSNNVVPDALSRRSNLFVLQEVSPTLHPLDWPLLIPYIIEETPIPSDIPLSACYYDRANLTKVT
jgi:hypothetical protein